MYMHIYIHVYTYIYIYTYIDACIFNYIHFHGFVRYVY